LNEVGVALWRVFPWDPEAVPGAPFSPSFVPRPSGRGRFDLPAKLSPVLYLAESVSHGVAEHLHPWRGRRIGSRHLISSGHRLAAAAVRLPDGAEAILDLCTAPGLVEANTQADRVASEDRATTQSIARAVWDGGSAGLRWWSRFHGDWHTAVLFVERWAFDGPKAGPRVVFSDPVPLTLDSPGVTEAMRRLGIEPADG
jgi:hypothetical protein